MGNTQSNDSGVNLMNSENRLLADLADFNVKYNTYIACNNEYINPGNSKLKCSNVDLSKNTYVSAYEKLKTTSPGYEGSVINVNNNLKAFANDPKYKNISPAIYDASFQYIKNTHQNDILKLRSELDAKLKELYATEDSRMNEYANYYDTTMYVGILWTILATSGLYYAFTKL
jgi:hypothetical protein